MLADTILRISRWFAFCYLRLQLFLPSEKFERPPKVWVLSRVLVAQQRLFSIAGRIVCRACAQLNLKV